MSTNKERKWPAGTADKINEWAENHLGLSLEPWQMDLLRQTEVPQPRTLADMTPEEREACRWMQADFDDGIAERPIRVVITQTGKATADIILQDGAAHWTHFDKLTPLPDFPRMVWPDEHYLATDEDVSIIPPKIDTSTGHDDDVDMAPGEVTEVVRLRRQHREPRRS